MRAQQPNVARGRCRLTEHNFSQHFHRSTNRRRRRISGLVTEEIFALCRQSEKKRTISREWRN
uniref:Uncharacterized protein n=1 Tax=Anopheles atroparvus TaxID=41427 RepID=A0AAG5DBF1_ANOAO